MQTLAPLREIEKKSFSKNDTLIIFGEVFQRGYANGLIEEAEKFGMKIIYSTIGRRENNQLRNLNETELAEKNQPLINIPIEAGFDLDLSDSGKSPIEIIKDCKLNDWQNFKIDWQEVNSAKKNALIRFRSQVKNYLSEIEKHLPSEGQVIFAHIMAGGVPRAKIIMPLMNRAFKGKGERYLSSELFWQSDLGQLCAKNFQFVSADTFQILIEETEQLRKKLAQKNRPVTYLAYGYHGTEICTDKELFWQSYTPYLQGWAKKQLEAYAEEARKKGIQASVYNCPEILTNSSSIFQGVEIPLYTLIHSLQIRNKFDPELRQQIVSLLKSSSDIDEVLKRCREYYQDADIQTSYEFSQWPQYSTEVQMNKMLDYSDQLIDLHQNEKQLITSILSEIVFKSCGVAMLHDCTTSKKSTQWIGHDLVAQLYSRT